MKLYRKNRLSMAAVLIGVMAGAALPAAAQDEPDCKAPETQADMTFCAGKDYEEADAQLNADYQKLRKLLTGRDRDAAEDDKGATDALVAAQRAWVTFRDANCELSGFQARGGSMEPMLVASCLAEMSRSRAEELRTLAEGF